MNDKDIPKKFRYMGKLCHYSHSFEENKQVVYKWWRSHRQSWVYEVTNKYMIMKFKESA